MTLNSTFFGECVGFRFKLLLRDRRARAIGVWWQSVWESSFGMGSGVSGFGLRAGFRV